MQISVGKYDTRLDTHNYVIFSFLYHRYLKILRLQVSQHNPCLPQAYQNTYLENDLDSIERIFEETRRAITLKAYES